MSLIIITSNRQQQAWQLEQLTSVSDNILILIARYLIYWNSRGFYPKRRKLEINLDDLLRPSIGPPAAHLKSRQQISASKSLSLKDSGFTNRHMDKLAIIIQLRLSQFIQQFSRLHHWFGSQWISPPMHANG